MNSFAQFVYPEEASASVCAAMLKLKQPRRGEKHLGAQNFEPNGLQQQKTTSGSTPVC